MLWIKAEYFVFCVIGIFSTGTPITFTAMSEVTGRTNEPYYRREFKQEQFLYEETSNFVSNPAEGSCFNQPNHYMIFTLVSLLFLGSLCLLSLDLLYTRRSADEESANRRQKKAPKSQPPRGLTPPPRREWYPPAPHVIINDANDDDMSDIHVTGTRHNNTSVSPEHQRI